jgi:hypothetical protein
MTPGEDIRLRALLKEAESKTPHVGDPKAWAQSYHHEVWIAVRIVCEALLAED